MQLLDNSPGRSTMRVHMAYIGLTTGLLLGWSVAEEGSIIPYTAAAGAVGGFLGADYYRPGEPLSTSVPAGVTLQTLCGILFSVYFPLNLEQARGYQVTPRILLAGAVSGLATGLYTHRQDESNSFRWLADGAALFSGGALSMVLFHWVYPDRREKMQVIGNAGLTGALLGYGFSYYTKQEIENRPRKSSAPKVSLHLIPQPEPLLGAQGELSVRLRVPGVIARF